MTKQELEALRQLLGRIPLMLAEALWLQGLLAKLEAQIKEREKAG